MASWYPTKRDLRFSLPIWAVTLGLFGPAVSLLWQQPGLGWWAGTFLFTLALMAHWTVQSIGYRLDTGRLRISAGFMRWDIPLADIRTVTPVRNAKKGPALAVDRLEIAFVDKGMDETVLISPVDRAAFVTELGQFDRGLKRHEDGLRRK
jgi:hypothetical protein